MMDIDELSDRAEIQDQIIRYYRGIDRFDLELVRSVFHPDAKIVCPMFYSGDRDGFISFLNTVAGLRGYSATKHFAGNISIETDGSLAFTETSVTAYHECNAANTTPGWAGRFIVVWLRYIDTFERRIGHWAIARRRFVFDWARDETKLGEWLEISPEFRGRRDRHDPVYHRAAFN